MRCDNFLQLNIPKISLFAINVVKKSMIVLLSKENKIIVDKSSFFQLWLGYSSIKYLLKSFPKG